MSNEGALLIGCYAVVAVGVTVYLARDFQSMNISTTTLDRGLEGLCSVILGALWPLAAIMLAATYGGIGLGLLVNRVTRRVC